MLSIVLFLVVSIKYNIQTFLAFILMVGELRGPQLTVIESHTIIF